MYIYQLIDNVVRGFGIESNNKQTEDAMSKKNEQTQVIEAPAPVAETPKPTGKVVVSITAQNGEVTEYTLEAVKGSGRLSMVDILKLASQAKNGELTNEALIEAILAKASNGSTVRAQIKQVSDHLRECLGISTGAPRDPNKPRVARADKPAVIRFFNVDEKGNETDVEEYSTWNDAWQAYCKGKIESLPYGQSKSQAQAKGKIEAHAKAHPSAKQFRYL